MTAERPLCLADERDLVGFALQRGDDAPARRQALQVLERVLAEVELGIGAVPGDRRAARDRSPAEAAHDPEAERRLPVLPCRSGPCSSGAGASARRSCTSRVDRRSPRPSATGAACRRRPVPTLRDCAGTAEGSSAPCRTTSWRRGPSRARRQSRSVNPYPRKTGYSCSAVFPRKSVSPSESELARLVLERRGLGVLVERVDDELVRPDVGSEQRGGNSFAAVGEVEAASRGSSASAPRRPRGCRPAIADRKTIATRGASFRRGSRQCPLDAPEGENPSRRISAVPRPLQRSDPGDHDELPQSATGSTHARPATNARSRSSSTAVFPGLIPVRARPDGTGRRRRRGSRQATLAAAIAKLGNVPRRGGAVHLAVHVLPARDLGVLPAHGKDHAAVTLAEDDPEVAAALESLVGQRATPGRRRFCGVMRPRAPGSRPARPAPPRYAAALEMEVTSTGSPSTRSPGVSS